MADTTRDHLANERTFLAWVRTSLGMIGLGFVLARMGLFLRQFALTVGSQDLPRPGFLPGRGDAPRAGHEFIISGVVFLVVGTLLGGWSYWHYDRNRRAIAADRFEPADKSVLVLAAVVVVGSLAIMGLVVWRLVVG